MDLGWRRWIVLGLVPAFMLSCSGPEERPWRETAEFTGSEACRPCHEDFFRLWADSHHGLALQETGPDFASRNLTPQQKSIRIDGVDFKFENGRVVEQADGGVKVHQVRYAMGGKNVFYFLTERERGHLQVLPVAYDTNREEWYDTTASMVRHFPSLDDEAVEWTDRSLTFNTSCYNCHVSQLTTNYDLDTDSYQTSWLEPGINCEACHGPGSEHIEEFKDYEEGSPWTDLKILDINELTTQQRSEMCAPCHAKMYPLSPGYKPEDRLYDHYGIHTLEHVDFYPDGRDLGENFTYTLWLLNPCAESGELDCVYCHTSSGRNRFPGEKSDRSCLPCHEELVNDPESHTFHSASSEGSRCIACHMPRTEFARMIRHDHSFLGPTPQATIEFESPNACNICHKDESAAWADEWARKWYGDDYQDEVMRRARLVNRARQENWEYLDQILDYIAAPESDKVYRASLIRLLAPCRDDRKWPVLEQAAGHPSPLVRAAAVDGLASHPDPDKLMELLLAAVRDDYRLVRIRAAAVLAELPLDGLLDQDQIAAVGNSFDELETSLASRPDDWSSHYNSGNFYAGRGLFHKAAKAYGHSLSFRPDEIPVLVNQSMTYARMGNNGEAEELLRHAVSLAPDNEVACFNLGLLLAEEGQEKEAEHYLRQALQADPGMAEAAHNLAILLSGDRIDEAIAMSRLALRESPENPRYGYTLSFFLHQKGRNREAIEQLESLISKTPSYSSAYPLLGSLLEGEGDYLRAGEVYVQASRLSGLDPGERNFFSGKSEEMRILAGGSKREQSQP